MTRIFDCRTAFLPHLLLACTLAGMVPGAIALGDTPAPPAVTTLRTPNGGIQPQALIDVNGTIHLVYFKGEPQAGDVFYVTRPAGSAEFLRPIRVNSQPASAVAMGNIRGAQLALGKGGRVHVAWNGSEKATPRGGGDPDRPGKADAPMLYARMNDARTAFEPQRNLMQSTFGLDGGGCVTADAEDNVYVAWHGRAKGAAEGEAGRAVWLAISRDGGKTFGGERKVSPDGLGACGCCGMRAGMDGGGRLYLLFRSAGDMVHRDMHALSSGDGERTFTDQLLGQWDVRTCPMSSSAVAPLPAVAAGGSRPASQPERGGAVLAWETKGQIGFAIADAAGKAGPIQAISGDTQKRRHPACAVGSDGHFVVAWTEGVTWGQGGAAAWRVYDRTGQAVDGAVGQADGVPAWGLVSALANPAGGFVVIY